MVPALPFPPATQFKEAVSPPPGPHIWHTLSLARFGLALVVAASHLRPDESMGGVLNLVVKGLASLSGHAAVISFLLISGFSIAHSLRQQPEGFIRRRIWRIYPIYLAGLFFTFWVSATLADPPGLAQELSQKGPIWVAHLFMLQGVTCEAVLTNMALWTLSLEWWFYLLSPVLIRLSGRSAGWLLGILTVGFLSWMGVSGQFGFYSHVLGGLNLLFIGIFWMLGFVFYFYRHHSFSGLALVASVWFLTGINRESLGGNAQLTLLAGTLALVVGQAIPWPKKLQPLITLAGNLSFPLYVFHLPLFHLAHQQFKISDGALLLAGAVLLALAAHGLIEVPLKLLRSRR